jgi:uncharacterized membrane protein
MIERIWHAVIWTALELSIIAPVVEWWKDRHE